MKRGGNLLSGSWFAKFVMAKVVHGGNERHTTKTRGAAGHAEESALSTLLKLYGADTPSWRERAVSIMWTRWRTAVRESL